MKDSHECISYLCQFIFVETPVRLLWFNKERIGLERLGNLPKVTQNNNKKANNNSTLLTLMQRME